MPIPRHPIPILVLAAILAIPAFVLGADITMQATKSDGGAVRLCVGLNSSGEKVAGTQNDLVWDGSCARLKSDSCAAVPDAKKPLHGNVPANAQNTYRALVFALDNVDPIRDGALYCCDFELTAAAECCAVKLDRLGASDPVGNALPASGQPPAICLASGAPASGDVVPAPGAAPATSGSTAPWLWIGLIAAAVIIAALLATRRKA
ncbi:MAG: hypothetical protein AB7N53_06465 [Candidatus Binatia bacterium]